MRMAWLFFRIGLWAGYDAGYRDALADLRYSPESRRALFLIMMHDGYQPRRRLK